MSEERTKLMPPSGSAFLFSLAAHVFSDLGLDGWKVRTGVDTWCDNHRREICISDGTIEGEPWYYVKELFLHEVAHVGETRPGSVQTHDAAFFRRLGELFIRFADFEQNAENQALTRERQ